MLMALLAIGWLCRCGVCLHSVPELPQTINPLDVLQQPGVFHCVVHTAISQLKCAVVQRILLGAVCFVWQKHCSILPSVLLGATRTQLNNLCFLPNKVCHP